MEKSTQRLFQIAGDPRCKRLFEVVSAWKVSFILMDGVVTMASLTSGIKSILGFTTELMNLPVARATLMELRAFGVMLKPGFQDSVV